MLALHDKAIPPYRIKNLMYLGKFKLHARCSTKSTAVCVGWLELNMSMFSKPIVTDPADKEQLIPSTYVSIGSKIFLHMVQFIVLQSWLNTPRKKCSISRLKTLRQICNINKSIRACLLSFAMSHTIYVLHAVWAIEVQIWRNYTHTCTA